ncbi:hypothetical protein V8C86DRAFT_2704266 [Haematococcus lacustris]
MLTNKPPQNIGAWRPAGVFHPRQHRKSPHKLGRSLDERAAASAQPSAPAQPARGVLGRLKQLFAGSQMDKAKLASLGMGAFASYGVISNLTYGTCLTIAWLSFVKAKGVTPLAPGQWVPFLGFYAGLWTLQNFARPLRFAAAVALAPAFERAIAVIGARTGLPKSAAFALLLLGVGLTTVAGLGTALVTLGGFPAAALSAP